MFPRIVDCETVSLRDRVLRWNHPSSEPPHGCHEKSVRSDCQYKQGRHTDGWRPESKDDYCTFSSESGAFVSRNRGRVCRLTWSKTATIRENTRPFALRTTIRRQIANRQNAIVIKNSLLPLQRGQTGIRSRVERLSASSRAQRFHRSGRSLPPRTQPDCRPNRHARPPSIAFRGWALAHRSRNSAMFVSPASSAARRGRGTPCSKASLSARQRMAHQLPVLEFGGADRLNPSSARWRRFFLFFIPHSPDERRFRPIATHDSMGKSIA